MRVPSALAYYAASIPRLFIGLKQPWRAGAVFLGLARLPTEVELRGSGLRFRIRDAMDLWVLKETCLDDVYCPRWLRPGRRWRVLDVGAGIGDFAVMMASRCPDGVVHAYEPMAASFTVLEENLALNGTKNVVAHRAALASRAGELSLSALDGRSAVFARFTPGAAGETRVPARGLASAIQALPGAECDLMKVDSEGGEFDLLLGSDPAPLRRVRRVSLEYHDGFTASRGTDIARHLESQGFRVWMRPNPVHRHLGQLYAERAGAGPDGSPAESGVSLTAAPR
jgi:FkbM family methyltransferase